MELTAFEQRMAMFMFLGLVGLFVLGKFENDSAIAGDTRRAADALVGICARVVGPEHAAARCP